jgi:copper chaperone
MEHIAIDIAGMHCQGCVKSVTGILSALPGVAGVKVSLEAARAEIDYDPNQATPARFAEAIESAGFDVTPAA